MGNNKAGEQALREIERASTGAPIKARNQCVAHKKTGERCQKAPILGATVCRFHGGAARHVKAAAKARLENAADRMARQLLGMVEDSDTPPAVKLAAIKDALDRAGLSPRQALDVSVALAPWEQLAQGMQLQRGPRPLRAEDPDVVDAELVDTGPEGEGGAPACRACGLDFSDWPEPAGGYPALCRTCRAAESTPRPSPHEPDSAASQGPRRDREAGERPRSAADRVDPHRGSEDPGRGSRRPPRDHGAAPGGSEHGLFTAEEAASRAARGNPRVRRKRTM